MQLDTASLYYAQRVQRRQAIANHERREVNEKISKTILTDIEECDRPSTPPGGQEKTQQRFQVDCFFQLIKKTRARSYRPLKELYIRLT